MAEVLQFLIDVCLDPFIFEFVLELRLPIRKEVLTVRKLLFPYWLVVFRKVLINRRCTTYDIHRYYDAYTFFRECFILLALHPLHPNLLALHLGLDATRL